MEPPALPVTPQKRSRNRALFSCAFCRASKLKCDRKSPCTQCARRDRTSADCVYAPMPPKSRKSRGIAAKLKQLEGNVREMMHDTSSHGFGAKERSGGRVVLGEQGEATYVGATHFMTILDDLEDLKQYFEGPNSDHDDEPSPGTGSDQVLDMFMLSESCPRGKYDLLRVFPSPHVLDRLVMRYFAWRSPSSHVIHRPSFNRQYQSFRQDPGQSSYEFLALLFMVIAEATLFSTFSAPQEIASDSLVPPMDRVREYRSAGVRTLSTAGFVSPRTETIPPLLLHLEAEFVMSRSTPMKCYLLSATCIRLMLHLGFHRDPVQLPNVTVFWGEMRRRMWHFGLQIEMLVSVHTGLPSIIHGIDSDTELPRNLTDDDFDVDTIALPVGRPDSENTTMTYFKWKTTIGRVFGLIAKQTHLLGSTIDADTMKLDAQLEDVWRRVPIFLKARPLAECVTDDPLLVMERLSLGALYHKGQCLLHRRFLFMKMGSFRPEHIYSRHTCLRAALALLEYQTMYYEATRPGGMLAQFTWFLRPIIVGDFLLGAVIIHIILHNPHFPENSSSEQMLPGKYELCNILARSSKIWESMAEEDPTFRKPAEMLASMTAKAHKRVNAQDSDPAVNHRQDTDVELLNNGVSGLTRKNVQGQDDKAIHPSDPTALASHYLTHNQTTASPGAAVVGFEDWFPFGNNSIDWRTIDQAVQLANIPTMEVLPGTGLESQLPTQNSHYMGIDTLGLTPDIWGANGFW